MVKPSPFWRCGIKRKLATIEDRRVLRDFQLCKINALIVKQIDGRMQMGNRQGAGMDVVARLGQPRINIVPHHRPFQSIVNALVSQCGNNGVPERMENFERVNDVDRCGWHQLPWHQSKGWLFGFDFCDKSRCYHGDASITSTRGSQTGL